MKKILLSAIMAITLGFTAFSTGIHYVNHAVPLSGDGSSWIQPFKTLQEALDAAVSGDEIWVTAGVYIPTSAYDLSTEDIRLRHFRLKNGVSLYGGFTGTETELTQRNFKDNVTILSGDLGDGNNAYHVFYHSALSLDETAILDGFTITGGKADNTEEGLHAYGGGMLNVADFTMNGEEPVPVEGTGSSPTIRNCIFFQNEAAGFGGGIANFLLSSPKISNCAFTQNTAGYAAGVMNAFQSNAVYHKCLFNLNTGSNDGGAMGIWQESTVTLDSCTFMENTSGGFGGGIDIYRCNSIINACMFNGNSGQGGGAIRVNENSEVTVTNSSFVSNTAETEEGGALYNKASTLIVKNSRIRLNTSLKNGGGIFNTFDGTVRLESCFFLNNESLNHNGGGIAGDLGTIVSINCLFSGNKANDPDASGGAIFVGGNTTIINATISGNSGGAVNGTAGGIFNNAELTILNSIVYGNNAAGFREMHNTGNSFISDYSCYPSGEENHNITVGTNDIHDEPGFKATGDHFYLITGNSPCADAGTNMPFETGGIAEDITTDIRGTAYPRILNKNTGLPAGGIVDIGAYETEETLTWKPSFPTTGNESILKNYPNPFNLSTTIAYTLKNSGYVEITIYNVLGQVVRTLERSEKTAGTYSVTWEGKDDKGNSVNRGIYLCRMITGVNENAVLKIQFVQ